MKKIIIFLVLCITAFSIGAQTDIFLPPHPITFGQGGAYTANAEGFNAFFYNPAGFALDSELTLLSVNAYAFADPSLLEFVVTQLGGSEGMPTGTEYNIVSRQTTEEQSMADMLAEFGITVTPELETQIDAITDWAGSLDETQLEGALTGIMDSGELSTEQAELIQGIIDNPDGVTQEDLTAAVVTVALPLLAEPTNIIAIIEAAEDGSGVEISSVNGDWNAGTLAAEAETFLTSSGLPSGNIRAGANLGVGYVGNGIGLGLFVNADATFSGASLLQTQGRVFNTITVAAGVAFPIGPLTIGAQVRPTFIGYSVVNPVDFIGGMLSGSENVDPLSLFGDIYTGFRIGIDVGALFELGPLTLGAVIKDLVPFKLQSVSRYTAASYIDSFSNAEIPLDTGAPLSAEEVEALYDVPPLKFNIGAHFHPDLGAFSFLIDPSVSVDIHDFFGFLRASDEILQESRSILNYLNIGAEVTLLRFATVRAGFAGGVGGGALSAGVGLHLLFLDVNAAVAATNFTQTADGGYEFSNIGFSLEAALRF